MILRAILLPRGARSAIVSVAIALACLLTFPAGAAQIQFTLPTVTASPGATVVIPVESNPAPAGLGILSVEFRINFTPGVIQSSVSRPDGWVQSWGNAFSAGNDAFVAVAAGGFPAATSVSTRVNTLELTVSPSAPSGTDMPLTFSRVLCNEGEPAVVVVPGLLRVRSTAAAGPVAVGRFALSVTSPNPASSPARFALTVPSGGATAVRLAVYSLDGRLVRELARGEPGAGQHEYGWDLLDGAGERVRAGLYFVRAVRGTEVSVSRLVVTR